MRVGCSCARLREIDGEIAERSRAARSGPRRHRPWSPDARSPPGPGIRWPTGRSSHCQTSAASSSARARLEERRASPASARWSAPGQLSSGLRGAARRLDAEGAELDARLAEAGARAVDSPRRSDSKRSTPARTRPPSPGRRGTAPSGHGSGGGSACRSLRSTCGFRRGDAGLARWRPGIARSRVSKICVMHLVVDPLPGIAAAAAAAHQQRALGRLLDVGGERSVGRMRHAGRRNDDPRARQARRRSRAMGRAGAAIGEAARNRADHSRARW